MVKTRIFLVLAAVVAIALLFRLPKAVVENEAQLEAKGTAHDPAVRQPNPHGVPSKDLLQKIKELKVRYLSGGQDKKNAIFADSLASLYRRAGKLDSAAWFAGEAATFLKTIESFRKAGQDYYDALTFAVDREKQEALAEKSRQYFGYVIERAPKDLDAKAKMAMTYVSSSTPMKGIIMLREVLADDPKNELALFNMGMLSIQSGQYDRAIERLQQLVAINPQHVQGHLLLGVAYLNKGEKAEARKQFEKVKQLDKDPSVQATADSYLNDSK